MKRNIYIAAISFLSAVIIASVAISEDQGNYRKGSYYYKNTCKKCHTLSEIGDGKTKQPHTLCVPEKEWISNFQSKKFDMYGCKEIEKDICVENLKHVYKYLHTPSEEEPDVTNCRVIKMNRQN